MAYKLYDIDEHVTGSKVFLCFYDEGPDELAMLKKNFGITQELMASGGPDMTKFAEGAVYTMDTDDGIRVQLITCHASKSSTRGFEETLDHECCHVIDNIFDSIGFNQNRMTSKEEFAYFYAWLRGQIRVIANKYNDAKAKQPPKKPVKATKKA